MLFTKEWVINKAKSPQGLIVHKYSWGHEKLRKKARRLCKDGLLLLCSQDKTTFQYRGYDDE